TGAPVQVTGTATDTAGRVGGVEVSVDNGATWHRATGRASWSYSWTPTVVGPATIRSRAVDDSGNLEQPAAGVAVSVSLRPCPCSIWDNATPASSQEYSSLDAAGGPKPIEVGVKFRADT